MEKVPPIRITECNGAPINPKGKYVLYWMTSFRRIHYNYALQRAVEWAIELKRPLLVLEALRIDYPWANYRIHAFVLQGMFDNWEAFKDTSILYYPYVERKQGEGKGLLKKLSEDACLVVTDDFPCFFIPKMLSKAKDLLAIRLEKVDSNGIVPLKVPIKAYEHAYQFRRFWQQKARELFEYWPRPNPIKGADLPRVEELPEAIRKTWPPLSEDELRSPNRFLSGLSQLENIPQSPFEGGRKEALKYLNDFLENKLFKYSQRNHPDAEVESNLSPYLHFGHISSHEILQGVFERTKWDMSLINQKLTGKNRGWWGLNEDIEIFLDQLITWRELGYHFCFKRRDYSSYESLPDWAKATLERHTKDIRPVVYELKDFEEANTHDRLWNAAQRQLLVEGKIHNYMRMLWGKKILEWTKDPIEALNIMEHLNNLYAVDGRDPNSYTGIFWILGRHDRPWAPERPIFGTVRYMSTEAAQKKLRLKKYLSKWATQ